MSSSKAPLSNVISMSISEFQYRQMIPSEAKIVPSSESRISVDEEYRNSEEQIVSRLAAERAAGEADAETKLRKECEAHRRAEEARVSKVIADFEQTRKEYFMKVESEVVQLALAIAGKILHREAQVDPMLIAALVQIALTQLKEGSTALIRVRPEDARRWREHFSSLPLKLSVSVVEDAELEPEDCLLETELGTANYSIDVQLKEVQQGFFDVLAQKPRI